MIYPSKYILQQRCHKKRELGAQKTNWLCLRWGVQILFSLFLVSSTGSPGSRRPHSPGERWGEMKGSQSRHEWSGRAISASSGLHVSAPAPPLAKHPIINFHLLHCLCSQTPSIWLTGRQHGWSSQLLNLNLNRNCFVCVCVTPSNNPFKSF